MIKLKDILLERKYKELNYTPEIDKKLKLFYQLQEKLDNDLRTLKQKYYKMYRGNKPYKNRTDLQMELAVKMYKVLELASIEISNHSEMLSLLIKYRGGQIGMYFKDIQKGIPYLRRRKFPKMLSIVKKLGDKDDITIIKNILKLHGNFARDFLKFYKQLKKEHPREIWPK